MTGLARRRGAFSVQERERLQRLLATRSVAEVARMLRRSEAAVRAAAERAPTPRRGERPFAAAADAVLRAGWGVHPVDLLARRLGCTPGRLLQRVDWLLLHPRRGPWSRADVQALKRLAGSRSDDALQVCLRRPAAEIRRKTAELCLGKDKRQRLGLGSARMPRWTKAAIADLVRIYPHADNLSIARQLGRTVTSVANKANRLGLCKSPTLLSRLGRGGAKARHHG